jgi:hypothetical protein
VTPVVIATIAFVRTQVCSDRRSRAAMHRTNQNRAANQPHAIRAKNRFWRAAMRREAGNHENFFIAKNRDSESAQRAFSRPR